MTAVLCASELEATIGHRKTAETEKLLLETEKLLLARMQTEAKLADHRELKKELASAQAEAAARKRQQAASYAGSSGAVGFGAGAAGALSASTSFPAGAFSSHLGTTSTSHLGTGGRRLRPRLCGGRRTGTLQAMLAAESSPMQQPRAGGVRTPAVLTPRDEQRKDVVQEQLALPPSPVPWHLLPPRTRQGHRWTLRV